MTLTARSCSRADASNRATLMTRGWLVAGLFAVMQVGGCDIPDRPPVGRSKSSGPSAVPTGTAGQSSAETLELAGGRIDVGWEEWHAYYVGDRHVGYKHLRCDRQRDGGKDNVVYELDDVLTINQGRARATQRLRQSTKETDDGRLISFTSSLQVGPQVTQYDGIRTGLDGSGSELQVDVRRGTRQTTETIPWDSTCRGLLAIEQSLRNRPLTARGQTRTLKMLLPGRYELATVRLKCGGDALVPMLGGQRLPLTEINYQIQVGDQRPTYATLWSDLSGNIHRTYTTGFDLVSYRTTKENATNLPEPIDRSLWLPVAGNIQRPRQAKRVAFEVSPLPALLRNTPPDEQDDLLEIFPAPRQMVRRAGSGRFQILTSSLDEPQRPGFDKSDLTPTKFDRDASHYVDYRNTNVRRFAEAIGRGRKFSQDDAIEMTSTVQSLIRKDASQPGLVKASEVVQLSSGNELGRSIFLCAMLRARKVPARIALGLRYVAAPVPDPTATPSPDLAETVNPDDDNLTGENQDTDQAGTEAAPVPRQSPTMEFHPWTLAYLDDRWIPLDVEVGSIAPPDRLILSTVTLASKREYEAFIPMLETVSRMQVKVLKAQY